MNFINAPTWLTNIVRRIIRPRPRIPIWQWADANVNIPDDAGAPKPGPLRTSRFPILRGLYDLAQKKKTRKFTFCASARVGKTLFCIVLWLYWIAERTGSLAWLDPSASSARKLVRAELDRYMHRCEPVWALAQSESRASWSTFWKGFLGKIGRVLGSGAEADMHGFDCEFAVLNELDRCRESTSSDASSAAKIEARTKLFQHSSLIVANSTPGAGGEFSPIWKRFLDGQQFYCYVPCPHCSESAQACGPLHAQPSERPVEWSERSMEPHLCGWQRLTFSNEEKLVPFDAHLAPLPPNSPRDEWRKERTGRIRFEQFARWADRPDPHDVARMVPTKVGYDMPALATDATYQCAHCAKDIPHSKLLWMLNRYRWCAHNPDAPHDHVSAHLWAAYSPFEAFGRIAKEFLEARNDLGALIKFCNMTKGEPYIRKGAGVKGEDLDAVIKRQVRHYYKGQSPYQPVHYTMTVDKQESEFWFTIRSWGLLDGTSEAPTFSALVDWGRAFSWDEILELACKKAMKHGIRKFTYRDEAGEVFEFGVSGSIVDAGNEQDLVFAFCARNRDKGFSPYKGAGPGDTRGNKIRHSEQMGGQIDLLLCWSDYFASNLYDDCIRNGMEGDKPVYWFLPNDIDSEYRKQLTDEFRDKDGWRARTGNNHLGDCEKMQRVFADQIEIDLEAIREDRRKGVKLAA